MGIIVLLTLVSAGVGAALGATLNRVVLCLAYFWGQLVGSFYFFYREKRRIQKTRDSVLQQRGDMP
ncbi:hypothetical protein N9L12_00035 [Luminiphilus sp.]|nr:hypothetical protein [Luminiphilus sp.]